MSLFYRFYTTICSVLRFVRYYATDEELTAAYDAMTQWPKAIVPTPDNQAQYSATDDDRTNCQKINVRKQRENERDFRTMFTSPDARSFRDETGQFDAADLLPPI